ncbi:MAG: hypothetical protein ACOCM4_01020 [Acetivibrio ethanolgignens]
MGFSEELLVYEQMKADVKVLEGKLADKREEFYRLEQEFTQLCKSMEKEKTDFDKLKKASLSQVIAKIAGNYDEKCDKEYREYIEVKRKYDDAQFQVEDVKRQIARIEAEMDSLKTAIPQKLKELRESYPEGKELGEKLDAEKEKLLCQKKEISEAVSAIERTRDYAQEALLSLDSAGFAATFDVVGGGGALADLVKYSALEKACGLVSSMRAAAEAMKRELSDVNIAFSEEIDRIDNGTRFWDIAFDNIFTDWAVRDRIEENKHKLVGYVDKLDSIQERLEKQMADMNEELENYNF